VPISSGLLDRPKEVKKAIVFITHGHRASWSFVTAGPGTKLGSVPLQKRIAAIVSA
jgi:hypothetical protein